MMQDRREMRTYLTLAWLFVALLGLVASCGTDVEGGEDTACQGVSCERGVCSGGECVNPPSCQGDSELCLEGYDCTDQDLCEANYPCSSLSGCERGFCQQGACISRTTCQEEEDCLPGLFCLDNSCQPDPCQQKTCERGVCQQGTGECISRDVCTEETEAEDCIDGFLCYEGSCLDEQALCDALACERGVCDFENKACANAESCGGEDAQCLQGFYCADDDSCQVNRCYQDETMDVRMCERGVCDPATDDCVNPETCTENENCLPMFLCVEEGGVASCVAQEQACGEFGCPGTQVCEHDTATLTASCVEDPEAGCTNALDCTADRVCVGGACQAPGTCRSDAQEPNDATGEVTVFHDAALVQGAIQGTICQGDVDLFSFDTARASAQQGVLAVTVALEPTDVGLGTLELELLGPDGTRVAGPVTNSAQLDDGQVVPTDRLQVELPIDIFDQGAYTIRLSGADDVAQPGLRYRLRADVVDPAVLAACQAPTALEPGMTVNGNSRSGDSISLRSSCADLQGQAAEDIYTFGLTDRRFVELVVTPAGSDNLSLSIRRDCASDDSEIAGGCVERGFGGEPERIAGVMDPGLYFVVVQGPEQFTGGTYGLSFTANPIICTPGETSCQDANTKQICGAFGAQWLPFSCTGGCVNGACGMPSSDMCLDPQVVSNGSSVSGNYQGSNELDPGVGTVGACTFSDPAVGTDHFYQVNLQPGQTVTASYTTSSCCGIIYIITDCTNVSSCVSTNGSEGSSGSASYTAATAETVYVVMDRTLSGSSSLTYNVSFTVQ